MSSHVSSSIRACSIAAAVLVAALLPGPLPWSSPRAEAAGFSITLNGQGTGRVFDGVGAVSAGASSRLLIDYPEPQRSRILDYLFAPRYGASLQLLKVEIGGDMNSTAGAEPSHMRGPGDVDFTRGYEWWLMAEAKRRNPGIQLGTLAWGAPGWLGQFFSQATIEYIVQFLVGARDAHGLSIDYVGIWNETACDVEWIKSLKRAVRDAGLATRIVAADQVNDPWSIVNAMYADPELMSAIDIVGEHAPQTFTSELAKQLNKPLWDSEDGPWRGDWTGAAAIAWMLNRNYIEGRMTSTQIWSPVSAYYDVMTISGSGLMYANTPWSGAYQVQPAIWAMAHTTQFAAPGWQYIDQSSGYFGGSSYVTLRHGSDYSVVVETLGDTDSHSVTFNVAGGLSEGTVHVWRSNADAQFIRRTDITPVNGSFTITFPPGYIYTLTTTSGQAKGGAQPPADSPFPVPYSEDFESYATGRSPRYLSDIDGAFETAPCGGYRPGQCLRQLVTTPPIRWPYAGLPQPASLVGSLELYDYQVSSDVLFEQPGEAKLIGRLISVDQGSGVAYGYQFYVADTGEWSLRINDWYALAGGALPPLGLNTWHSVKLVMNGGSIRGEIDGAAVVDIEDYTYTYGLAGVGVDRWMNAQFDALRIDSPSGPHPSGPVLIPQHQMTALATSEAPQYEAWRMLDGDASTFWHTTYSCAVRCEPTDPLPQSFVLDLGGLYNVTRLRYLTRQDGNLNGTLLEFTLRVSTDGVTWTTVAANAAWLDTPAEQSVSFGPVAAAYIWLEALQGHNGYAAAAEINVEYDPASPPPPPPPPPPTTGVIPQWQMSASVTGEAPDYEAWRMLDGDASTFWHTGFSCVDQCVPTDVLPQSFILTLGGRYDVTGLRYLTRQDGNLNGSIIEYVVRVSTDGIAWTTVAAGEWADDPSEKTVSFAPVDAAYVWVEALQSHSGYTAAAEVNVEYVPAGLRIAAGRLRP